MRSLIEKESCQQPTDVPKPYEWTPEQRAAIETMRVHRKKSPRVRVNQKADRALLSWDGSDQLCAQALLMKALGTADLDFLRGIIAQIGDATSSGPKVDEHQLNFLLSVIKGLEPKDQLETMLAAQMALFTP